MKKILLSLAVTCGFFALFGCNHHAQVQTLRAAELKPMQQSYRGILPCADCKGIETSLFLEKDGTWIMNQRYQGVKTPLVLASYGTWVRTAGKLVLTENDGEKWYFRPKADGFEMLDRKEQAIGSPFNDILKPVSDALPTTPMVMKGMYKYMADAAIFQDCATGKTFAVASNAELERGYAAARGKDSRPVLLTLEAHFTLQASPDSGEMQKTLVADKSAQFAAKESCND